MEANNDYFANRKEVFFIEYNGVIKDPNQYLLYLIFNDLYDTYKDFLFNEDYKGVTLDNCLAIASALEEQNIIAALTKKEDMDIHKVYQDLLHWDDSLYTHCEPMLFADSVAKTLKKPFCEKIYFYTPEYDERVAEDIVTLFGRDTRIMYCYGNIHEVIELLPDEITAVVLSNYDNIHGFKNYSKIDYTEFYLADHTYNSYYDREKEVYVPHAIHFDDVFKDKVVKIHSFTPMIYRNRHMEGIVEPVLEKIKKLNEEKQKDRD